MSKQKILLTCRWPTVVETALFEKFAVTICETDRPISQEGFKEALTKFDAVLPTDTDKITVEAFQVNAPRMKVLGNFGVGYAHIDTAAAKDRVS
jgi:lactate dehydrogenase-like 2-hydroxyacid dehydrogenase